MSEKLVIQSSGTDHAWTPRIDCRAFVEQVIHGFQRAQNDHRLPKRIEGHYAPVSFGPVCISQPGIVVRYVADKSEERCAFGPRRQGRIARYARSQGAINKKDKTAKEGER